MNFASPTDPGAFTVQNTKQRANQLIEAGDYATASEILEGVLKLAPRDPELIFMLGVALQRNSRNDQAVRRLKLAHDLAPNHLPTIAVLCECYQTVGEIGKAHKLADKLRELDPKSDTGILLKSRLFQTRGRAHDALELVRGEIQNGNNSPRVAAMFGVLCQHTGNHEEGVKALASSLDDVTHPAETRRDLYFTLGHLYDAMGDYDAAFKAIKRGNDMLDAVEPEDYSKFRDMWSRERVESLAAHGSDSEMPMFVLGMPRSGTTLTEQILLAHPAVETVGESTALKEAVRVMTLAEFSPESVGALAKAYLRDTATVATDTTERVLDKMPGNYAFLGIIACAMPNAKIVHTRRDARDTVLSCFFQNFGPRLPYSRRMESCARQYLCYLELMDHWRDVLDIPIYDSIYEELVADPEPKTRALIDHVNLPWNDACLAHHKGKSTVTTASIAQVRKPIYKTSRERWRRYEKHLGPMLEILQDV